MTSRPAAEKSHLSGLWLAVIGSVAAAAALLLAAGQVWLHVALPPNPPLPGVSASFTGQQMAGLVPIGILAGAAGLALIAGRRIVRLAVGSVLVLAGLLTVGRMWFQIDDEGWLTAFSWAQRYQPQDASLESIIPDRDFSAAPAWLALIGGGLIFAVGMMTILRSRRWPVMGARFERSRTATRTEVGDPHGAPKDPKASDAPASEGAMWAAMERGEDPTSTSPTVRPPDAESATREEPVQRPSLE